MAEINIPIAPRSHELIRNRVAEILASELFNQAAITYDDLFLAKVFVQRSKPVDVDECPVINVSLSTAVIDNHTAIDSDVEFPVFIDVFATADYTDELRGDTLASFEAQRLAGVIQGILLNPVFCRLGFAPPFIMRSKVTAFETGLIDRNENTNLAYVRTTLTVRASQVETGQDPITNYDLSTQVFLGETEQGYLYSGTGSPIPPPTCAPAMVLDSLGNLLATINSGGSGIISNSTAVLKDADGNVLETKSILAQGSEDIVAPDTSIKVNGVAEGSVVAGSTVDIQLSDSLGVVTPLSVTQTGNDYAVLLPTTVCPPAGWQRPSDWLAIPDTVSGEQVFYGLVAVQNVSFGNFVAFSFAGNYTVNWGDGSALENVSSGVTAQHQYNWADVGNVTSEGFRQALITVTPQSGQNITNINLQRAHSVVGNGRASLFLDMVMSLPNVTGANQTIGNGTFAPHRRCQRVWIKEIGAITVGTQMFFNFNSLQELPLFNTSSITLMNSMFNGCVSLETIPLFNTSLVTNMNSMFNGCNSLKTIPLIDAASATDVAQMFSGCSSLQSLPALNFVSVTGSMSTMFLSCISLQSFINTTTAL
jgi:hypothetical protein